MNAASCGLSNEDWIQIQQSKKDKWNLTERKNGAREDKLYEWRARMQFVN